MQMTKSWPLYIGFLGFSPNLDFHLVLLLETISLQLHGPWANSLMVAPYTIPSVGNNIIGSSIIQMCWSSVNIS